MRPILLVPVSVIALTIVGLAQEPIPSLPPFRSGVDVVQLDVVVLDQNRQPVRGLTAADFTILEQDAAQPIVSFNAVDLPDAVPAPPWMRNVAPDVLTNEVADRRTFIIVMDDAYTPPEATPAAHRIAAAVIERLGPSDLAAVIHTFMGRRQDFTGDHAALLAASRSFLGKNPDAGRSRTSAENGSAASPRETAGAPLGCRSRGRHGCVKDAMIRVADALQSAPPGRKAIVYIGGGQPFDFSMQNLDAANDIYGLQAMFRALQLANISIYPLDPLGLTLDGIVGRRLDSLRMFADNTGGRAVFATNDPEAAVAQIVRENSSYYLIGFQSADSRRDGRFRKVAVKVNRPGVEARTRIGYFAPKPPPRNTRNAATASQSRLQEVLAKPVPGGDFPLSVTLTPFARRGGGSALALLTAMQADAGGPAGFEADVLAIAFDQNFREKAAHPQRVRLPPPSPATAEPAEVLSRLNLPPGRYHVRVAVEGGGKAGAVFADVDLPDFQKERLTMSGLLVVRSGAGTTSSPLMAELTNQKPTTSRAFASNDRVSLVARVYQGGKARMEDVAITTRVVGAAPDPLFSDTRRVAAGAFDRERSVEHVAALPLGQLPAGEYLATVEAVMGERASRRDIRFSVR